MPKAGKNTLKRALALAVAFTMLLTAAAVLDNWFQTSDAATMVVVTNGNNAGAGSLRNAINSAGAGDTVIFESGVTTVTLTSEISFSKELTIDGGGTVKITKAPDSGFRLMSCTLAANQTLTLKGLTFENGNAGDGLGGGLYMSGDVELSNCVFVNNKAGAGGGAYLTGENISLSDCVFIDNETRYSNSAGTGIGNNGGGLYIDSGTAQAELTSCTFTGNKAYYLGKGDGGNGGGLYANTDVRLTWCQFVGNTAEGFYGDNYEIGTAGNGGGLYANADAKVYHSTFTGNTAISSSFFLDNFGGNGGGAVVVGTATLVDSTFADNETKFNLHGGKGGGAYLRTISYVYGCTFTGNIAFFGGGLEAYSETGDSLLIIVNSTFSENKAVGGSSDGGGIDCTGENYLFHVTITNNLSDGINASVGSNVYLYNCILAGNTDRHGAAPLQTCGLGTFDMSFGNLVEGESIPRLSPAITAYPQVFGMNDFDPDSGIHMILGNGIAVGTATPITDLSGTGLSMMQQAVVLVVLETDQAGNVRSTTAPYYGAVEDSSNMLVSVELGLRSSTKTIYDLDDPLDFTGGILTLTYFDGRSEDINMTDPGVMNDAPADITSTLGSKTITFSYLGISTRPGLDIMVLLRASTTTTLTSDINPSMYGESVTFTITVSSEDGTPTGHVNLYDEGMLMGTAMLSGGVATFTISTLFAPNHVIGAEYPGDDDFSSSASDPMVQIVNTADMIITLTSSGSPSIYGQNVTITATSSAVPPSTGIPGGTVTFYDGTTIIGTADLSGGVATFTTPELSAATHTITATCTGDRDFSGTTSAPLTQVVSKANTTITLTSSTSSPSGFGQDVIFTATVALVPASTHAPEGRVTFYDGTSSKVTLGTVAFSGGVATFTTSSLSVGLHAISAECLNDSNYGGSQSDYLVHEVSQEITSTTMQPSVGPTVYGQNATFTARVSVPGASYYPSGTVTFYSGTTPIGADVLSEGTVSFTTPLLNVGSNNISARYSGSTIFGSSTSATIVHTVNKADTATHLTSAYNPSMVGMGQITFDVTVSSVYPGAGTPTGDVEFFLGTKSLGVFTLVSGTASTSLLFTAADRYDISAYYKGSGNYKESSDTLAQIVKGGVAKEYLIKATALSGATISPSGSVSVIGGNSVTFNFKAELLIIDDVILTPEESRKGQYTFNNVNAHHTIEVYNGILRTDVTLKIDIKGGNGHVEYSVDGAPFVRYTDTVTIPENSNVVLRAAAADGYVFKEWRNGAAVIKDAQIPLDDLMSSVELEIYFEEKSDSLTLWVVAGVAVILLIAVVSVAAVRHMRSNKK